MSCRRYRRKCRRDFPAIVRTGGLEITVNDGGNGCSRINFRAKIRLSANVADIWDKQEGLHIENYGAAFGDCYAIGDENGLSDCYPHVLVAVSRKGGFQ